MESIFAVRSPIRQVVGALDRGGFIRYRASTLRSLTYGISGAEQAFPTWDQRYEFRLPRPDVDPGPIGSIRQISPTKIDEQLFTLDLQISATKLLILLLAAYGLEDRGVHLTDVEEGFTSEPLLLNDIAVLEIAFDSVLNGEWVDADAFRVHSQGGIGLRFSDIAEIEIVQFETGSIKSFLKVKWQEFESEDVHKQAQTLAAATVVAGALVGAGLWASGASAIDRSSEGTPDGPVEPFRIEVMLPLEDPRNAPTLEMLSQDRERYYEPASGRTKDLQSALKRLGFDPGPIDGIRGPRTKSAEKSAAKEWGIDGLDATDPTFRIELARRILLLGTQDIRPDNAPN